MAAVSRAASEDQVRYFTMSLKRHFPVNPSIPPTPLRIPADFRSALDFHTPGLKREPLLDGLKPKLSAGYSLPTKEGRHAPCGCERIVEGGNKKKTRSEFLERARMLLREEKANGHGKTGGLDIVDQVDRFSVRFTWAGPAQRSCFLAGSFNNWGLPVAMTKRESEKGDFWECVLRLGVGEYRYRYVVDGKWQVDESRLCEVVEGVAMNRVIIENMRLS